MTVRRVYKYPLTWNNESFVELPIHSEMLSVIIQDGKPVMYALVPIDRSPTRKIKITVRLYETGHDFTDSRNYKFLQTVPFGNFVWHFFYKEERLI